MIYQDQSPFYPAWGLWSYSWLEWPYFNLKEHGEQVIEMPSSHDHSSLPRDRPHSRVGLLELSWSQREPEAPLGFGREISLMSLKEFILESGKRMSENVLCYSLLIKLLFLKNMAVFFFGWIQLAFTEKGMLPHVKAILLCSSDFQEFTYIQRIPTDPTPYTHTLNFRKE